MLKSSPALPPVMLIVDAAKPLRSTVASFAVAESLILRVSIPVATRVAAMSASSLRAPSSTVKLSEEPVESARETVTVDSKPFPSAFAPRPRAVPAARLVRVASTELDEPAVAAPVKRMADAPVIPEASIVLAAVTVVRTMSSTPAMDNLPVVAVKPLAVAVKTSVVALPPTMESSASTSRHYESGLGAVDEPLTV